MWRALTSLTVLLLWVGLQVSAEQPPAAPAPPPGASVDFARDIRPILEANCIECHGSKKSRGRLRLDLKASAFKGGNTGPAVVAHQSDDSLVVRRVLGLDGEDRMPLDADPLPDAQIALLRAWIDQGAPWPDDGQARESTVEEVRHWAYVAPKRPAVPRVPSPDRVRTPIDAFILSRLEKEGLQPSREADKAALLRRVSLDLVGLPPTPAEIDAFLADLQPDAYERVVDRLLASPHYGERWARPWLDLARYADSNGYEKDRLRTMWKYRDWLIKALNDDMPFDRFTIEQIAGDMLPNPTTDQQIASGFHRNTQLNQEGGIDVEEARFEALLDRVNTTATVWLGSTIACAQCHNHKYDPFSQRDYYRLLAFFDNVEYTVIGTKPGEDRYIKEPVLDLPSEHQAARRQTLSAELSRLNAQLTEPSPEVDAAQPAWEAAQQSTSSSWTTLTASNARATSAKLTTQPDGSVLASGVHAGKDAYKLDVVLPAGPLTGLRLEALPDASLPKGGPGRDHYGNFVLTGFRVERLDGAAESRLTFDDLKVDDGSSKEARALIEPTPQQYREVPSGWAIDATRDETRSTRQLVVVPGKPLVFDTPTRARVTLAFDSGNVGQAIGRFRLSATGSDEPLQVVAIRARTRRYLAIAPDARTPEQAQAVRAEFRQQVPALKPVRDRVAELEREMRELGIVTALVMKEKPSFDRPSTPFRERGSFMSPGPRMYAATPDVLPPMRSDQMPNRLGLARWLVSPDNPLTARVTVNRAWEQFFGRGLVETSEDFGTQGATPSHPELLDWLAAELVGSGWKQKALHRLIVMSATYRQDAAATPGLIEKDPYNRLLARGPRFRMEAEMVRDVALAASGLLSPKIGGPSVFPVQPEGIWDNPYSDEVWTTSTGEDRYRRGIYTFIRRTSPYPTFMTFDATSREFCTVRRIRTNTPLQALTGLNDEAFFEAARALARRVAPTGPSASARRSAAEAFRLVTGRKPSEPEIDRIVQSYERQARYFRAHQADAAKVILAEPSAPHVAEQAAWTLVANALLNLDETLTK
jgi:hypothetical protein